MDALSQQLEALGLQLQPAWLTSCVAHLQASAPGFAALPVQHKAKHVLQQLLHSDLNQCGAAALPQEVQALHDTVLPGKLVLQVDEVVNIGVAVRERYSGNDGSSRCLKLLLTDGVQHVAAMEYRPTPALHSAMPAGTKLVVQGAAVRRGILLLTPQTCAVLGGRVARLEEARQRMVAHWTQPAVGRRGPPPSMQEAMAAASRAAWAADPAPGSAGAHPAQQQAAQVPAAAPQRQLGAPSQQPTQLLSHQQQAQQAQGGGPAGNRLHASQAAVAAAGRGAPPVRAMAQQQPQQQQQQPAQPLLPRPDRAQQHNSGSGGSLSFGQPTLQHEQQQQQQQQPSRQQQQHSGQSFSFGRQREQQPQHAGPAPAPAPAAAPLQEHNRAAAASGGQKRSRLALRQPPTQPERALQPAQPAADGPAAAADFAFAEPMQQQQQRQRPAVPGAEPAAARVQARAAPQLLQRPRDAARGGAAASDLAAGTLDDPICLSDDEQQQVPGSGEGDGGTAGGVDVEMAEAEQQEPGWQEGDALEREDELPPSRHLEPWERFDGGMDEQQEEQGAGQVAEAYGKFLPKDPGQLADGGGGNQGGAATGCRQEAGGDASDDGWDEEEEEEEEQPPPKQQPRLAAGRNAPAAAGAPAAAQLPAGPAGTAGQCPRRRSGQAAEQTLPPLGSSPADGAASKPQQAATRLGASKLEQQPSPPSGTDPSQQQQQQQKQQEALQPAVPQLEPPDPSLFDVAPSLTEVLYSAQPTPPQPPRASLPAGAAAASAGEGGGRAAAAGGSRGGALPSMPQLQPPGTSQQRPAAPSLLRLQQPVGAPASPAAPPAASPADSDEDMPSFDLLPDLSPDKPQQGAGGSRSGTDEPFIYLLQLSQRAASAGKLAGAEAFPLVATIFGTVKTFVGRLQFRHPQTGQPQYFIQMTVEDGSMVVGARLGAQFLRELLGLGPQQLEANLADAGTKAEAAELVRGVVKLLVSYSGLMAVRLEAPGAQLEVTNLQCDLTAEQLAAFQRRATASM
ncbi:hypothetical protein CHLNCDRAFT_51164 [Chlorella variabilis]|uniref:RecQ-mediated genome instability protein 1 n=1 Tax=Chlorella variabilis TaxID=554065 RepID=E1Z9W7_CHLVA|nr:hypothetical protein CHLNCDRAFT_51164 [Chlorella variabilis]EFN57844.1 hypothetical protein CHLNCDRAFT_51164 [Chlorella variabilis]|eukprot:XP_005849946.1 hypothetical protein CHLNCDRAFT_51164 [Chlorella variabilis]